MPLAINIRQSAAFGSFVKVRRLLQTLRMGEIVLNPQLRTDLFGIGLDLIAGRNRLLTIEFEGWRTVAQRPLFPVMIKIAGQNHWPELSQLHHEHLMTRSMPDSSFHNHRAVPEHVVLVLVENDSLVVLQKVILTQNGSPWLLLLGEHGVALLLPHQPRRLLECIRVPRMIEVIV